jgi:hypothetical protein
MGLLADTLEFVTGRLPRLYYEYRDKRRLKVLLNDPRWPDGRSIDRLSKEIGRDQAETRRLLNDMGARSFDMANGEEGWRMRR